MSQAFYSRLAALLASPVPAEPCAQPAERGPVAGAGEIDPRRESRAERAEPPSRNPTAERWLARRLPAHAVPIQNVREDADRAGKWWPGIIDAAQNLGVQAVRVGVERGGIACWQRAGEVER